MALVGAALLGGMDLLAYHAVHNEGEDPYLLGFTVVFSMILALFGSSGLAVLGLALHGLGLGLGVLAFRWESRVMGALLAGLHAVMLVVDVLYLLLLVILILGG